MIYRHCMPINSKLAVQQEAEISPVEALGYMFFSGCQLVLLKKKLEFCVRTGALSKIRLDNEEKMRKIPARCDGNAASTIMKADIHPKYNPVVFVDITTGRRFITRSTATSAKKEEIDGVEHYVISCGITSDSHPFFTGKNQFVDTEGRIDKFQKRFGAVRRAKKPTLG